MEICSGDHTYLEKKCSSLYLCLHHLPVPAVAHVYAESSLVYKLVVMKNRNSYTCRPTLQICYTGGPHLIELLLYCVIDFIFTLLLVQTHLVNYILLKTISYIR